MPYVVGPGTDDVYVGGEVQGYLERRGGWADEWRGSSKFGKLMC